MLTNPKTELLPQGWQRCLLTNFTTLVMGQSPPSRTYNDNGNGLPFFQGKAEFGDLYPHPHKYCSEPKKIAEEGATLLSVRAPVGPTNLAAQRCCVGRGLAAIHPSDGIDSKFILYLFRSIEPQLSSHGSGSTFDAITKSLLEDLYIDLPPLQEQRRIVAKIEELFSELDNGIENLETARKQLSIYRQALLKQAFEGDLTARWREASAEQIPSGQELLRKIECERSARYDRRLKQWETNESLQNEGRSARKPRKLPLTALPIAGQAPGFSSLPSRWTLVKVQDVLRERPANGRSVKDRESGFPVLRLTAIGDEGIDLSEYKEGDWEREDARPYVVKEGDFLLARGNGSRRLVGRGGLVSESQYDVAYPDTMTRLRVEPEVINNRFFSLVWNSRLVRRQIEAAAHTTAGIYKINQTHILNFVLPICSLKEQNKIVQILEERLSKIRAVEKEIDDQLIRSDDLRQAILKEAFSGQLVPQDPADEPASVLLERIQAERRTDSNLERKTGT